MGNICSWCLKNQDEPQSNGDPSGADYSQHSLSSSEVNDRTPLIGKSGKNDLATSINPNSQVNGELSSFLPPPPLPSVMNESRTETTMNETAETKMAIIVEGMLSKLIDVASGGSGINQTNSNTKGLNTQNDHLKQLLNKSLSSTNISSLPDVDLNNLPSLLSGRPISSDICHFVAHTAGELSRLLIDEIKIVHKEDLVVVFE